MSIARPGRTPYPFTVQQVDSSCQLGTLRCRLGPINRGMRIRETYASREDAENSRIALARNYLWVAKTFPVVKAAQLSLVV